MIELPHWRHWREIVGLAPMAVYPRPGFTLKARLSPAALALRPYTLDASDGGMLAEIAPPALVFLEGPESRHSATEIRARGGWPAANKHSVAEA